MTKQKEKWLWIGGAGIAAILIFAVGSSYEIILSQFLKDWEGFSNTPYWDVRQWSWGYGTKVPGSSTSQYNVPGGTITREKAMQDLLQYARSDKAYLTPLINVNLRPDQWAALLSFSYNLGNDDADNLVYNINTADWKALEDQWKRYIYVNGQISQHQIDRREAEWELFSS
jgi:lysozyme